MYLFFLDDDLLKITNLNQLSILSLNGNPLEKIPQFNNSKFRSLSLQDTLLTSAEFPSSYFASSLDTIIISNNKIRTINENDFVNLKNSRVGKLHIDSASLSSIHSNAFKSLDRLQSLSLKNNQLKSCEFLSNLPLLASIHLNQNQFTFLPQELSLKNNIKKFFFQNNLITIIDESSPLHTWLTKNYTNNQISLANNSFDCCQSLWFIQFLHTSSDFVVDAASLTCATPSNYTGQFLMKLDVQRMNCGGIKPNPTWWTPARITAISLGVFASIAGVILVIYIAVRQKQKHSSYTEIDGVDDPTPTIQHPFPAYGQEDDDNLSTYSTAPTRFTNNSHAPTNSTLVGISEVDYDQNPVV